MTNRKHIETYDDREFARFLASVAGYGGNKEEVDFWEQWLKADKSKEVKKAIEPKPKTGRWKVVSGGYGDSAYICECSECKDTVWVYKNADRKWNYCPSCGAKMVEPQESEDKE